MGSLLEITLILGYVLGAGYMFKIARSVEKRRYFSVLDKVPVNGHPFALFFGLLYALNGVLELAYLSILFIEEEWHVSYNFFANFTRHLQFLALGFMILTLLLCVMSFYSDLSRISSEDKRGLGLTCGIMLLLFLTLNEFPWGFLFLAFIFAAAVLMARQSHIDAKKQKIRMRNMKRK